MPEKDRVRESPDERAKVLCGSCKEKRLEERRVHDLLCQNREGMRDPQKTNNAKFSKRKAAQKYFSEGTRCITRLLE